MAEISEQEFCERLKARMMLALAHYDGTEAELSEYAELTAPTYFGMKGWGDDTPEDWASADISEWEES